MIALPAQFFTRLAEQGWAMSDEVIPADWRVTLKGLSQRLWEAGQFHEATIGKHASRQKNPNIRGDSICWLDFTAPPLNTHPIIHFLVDLRATLNQDFYLGLRSEEFHLARYDSGSGYSKHLDQHLNTSHRKISVVLYLNDDWGPEDGGELCLYGVSDTDASSLDANPQITRILPMPGRLVVFRSDTIWHEVLPTRRTRLSFTGWFRDDTPIG